MKQPLQNKFKWNALTLAFAFPCVGMLIVMAFSGFAPFGDSSMLYSDAWHQYFPFFKAYRAALLSGDSILYSWNVGMGMDYLGLISYYLASPLYLLSVLVPESLLLDYFSLLLPIRLGLAGLFFALFLKKTFHKEDLSIAVFGAFYALCAWALGYQWNVMWLDTFALLPLVALGTVALLRDKKFILYTLTLFQSIYSNYYIGFFTCIFVLLLFICYQICRWQSFKRFIADLFRIALFSVLAIGMTAVLELPALAALQTTHSANNSFPTGFKLNIADESTWQGLLQAMGQVAGNMFGGTDPTFKEGLPNLYCGVASVMLGFLYLTAGEIRIRDKICAVGLLLFFNVSFLIRQLDYIWHGFHFTNMIPYRFSFLYSFVLLYMAYRAWLLRFKFNYLHVLFAGLMTVACLFCAEDLLGTVSLDMSRLGMGDVSWDIPLFLIYNAVFLSLYLIIMIYGSVEKPISNEWKPRQQERAWTERNQRRANVSMLILVIMGVELAMNLVNFGCSFTGTRVTNYPKGTTYTKSVIRYMQEREEDTLFYRAEMTHSQTLNDGALNGYNGISTFTSSANVRVTEFMKALGYGAKNTYNRYCFEESSPVANLFLGLKYMIDRDEKDKASTYFEPINTFGKVTLLENKAYLPLGFLTEPELADLSFADTSGAFVFQNQLFRAATGLEQDVWHRMLGDTLTVTADNVTIRDQSSSGYCKYTDTQSNAQICYTYTVDQDGFLCFHFNLPKRNDITIYHNGELKYTETTSLPQMLAVGDVSVGDTVQIKLDCDSGETGTITLSAAILLPDRFWKGYEILAESTLDLTTFRNTLVEGTIQCDRDGLMYTSIPQNGNWSVLVDGQQTPIRLVGDAMIAVELTEGTHTVTFTYHNAAFCLGWKISLACLLIFAALVCFVYKPKLPVKKQGKYQK